MRHTLKKVPINLTLRRGRTDYKVKQMKDFVTHDIPKEKPDIPNAKSLSQENGPINKLYEVR